jgi:hypothetical protein
MPSRRQGEVNHDGTDYLIVQEDSVPYWLKVKAGSVQDRRKAICTKGLWLLPGSISYLNDGVRRTQASRSPGGCGSVRQGRFTGNFKV